MSMKLTRLLMCLYITLLSGFKCQGESTYYIFPVKAIVSLLLSVFVNVFIDFYASITLYILSSDYN